MPQNKPLLPMQAKSFGEFSSTKMEREQLVPGFITAAETTVILVAPDVQANVLIQLLPYCMCSGKPLPPFDKGPIISALLCIGSGDAQQDLEISNLILARDPSPLRRKRVTSNLMVIHRELNRGEPVFLDKEDGQRAIRASMPVDCKAVVLDDFNGYLSEGAINEENLPKIEKWIASLNGDGIAVLLFDRAAKNGQDARLLARRKSNLINLTKDPAAPTDLGGGFNIVRTKLDFNDKIPSKIQFWYKVTDGKLDFGWEYRDQEPSLKTAKQVELAERQLQVEALLNDNKSQREIAALMKVDPSTISRVVGKIKVDPKSTGAKGATALNVEGGATA